MRLYLLQLNDGIASDERPLDTQYDQQTPAELLDRKQASHEASGWTVEERTATTMHVWKLYDIPGYHLKRKDRYFEIR